MKAFLFAAGLGTRLRPLTDSRPKCLFDIGGKTMLERWIGACAAAGVDEVLVNTHHHSDMVADYVRSRDWPLHVIVTVEYVLLGSAGTMLTWKDWVENDKFFLACNADGLTDFPLTRLFEAHCNHELPATIAVFKSENPSAGGVAEIDREYRVTSFTEKPEHPMSNLVNAGMYAFRPSVFEILTADAVPLDIGRHLLPKLAGQMRALPVAGYYRDIGSLRDYALASKEWDTK